MEEGSRSERRVEVARGRWVRGSQFVSGVTNSRARCRGTDAVNQDGGVSSRSWFLMRSSVYIGHLGLISFSLSLVHLFIHQKALAEHLLHV